ncbi:phosphoenolpyruvate hydrolase family protein [Roseococcus thiosulfatophilus]|uniref:phosphoenolpyruvate hydrolase family protein n=1 Tax=Roseococcus thiosulfatophilus TaxID=35813 RepID=UPI001A8F1F88|nr:phosphoenolpyruvate hydrolase family protein [Roseococcus thiosulfatophilus]
MPITLRPAACLEGLPARRRPRAVFLPALAPFRPELWPLVVHLPVLDVNGALVAALAGRTPFRAAPPIAAIFACDPFLRLRDMAASLRAAGITEVVNLPSVQAHEGEAAAALGAVGYRAEREFRALLTLAEHGLRPLAYAARQEEAEAALSLGLRRILLPAGPGWADLASHVAVEGGEALAWAP